MDIICISETRLKDHKINYVQLPGYAFFFHNSDKVAGGAAIHVNKSLQANKTLSLKLNVGDTEDVWIEIGNHKNNNSKIVGSIYRHPRQNILNFECTFAQSLTP